MKEITEHDGVVAQSNDSTRVDFRSARATSVVFAPDPLLTPAFSPEPDRSRTGPWIDLAGHKPGAARSGNESPLRSRNLSGYYLRRALRLEPDPNSWQVGLRGERFVGRRLNRLGFRWRVIHSVPLGPPGADLNHLVIGPAGVFAISTTHHPKMPVHAMADQIRVLDQPRPEFLRRAAADAERAEELLSAALGSHVQVTPLLVVLCGEFTGRNPTGGAVPILAAQDVRGWLRSHGSRQKWRRVQQIFQLARRSTTWQPSNPQD